jgi:hypothetical protein
MGEVQMAKIAFYSISRRGCEPNEKIYQIITLPCEKRILVWLLDYIRRIWRGIGFLVCIRPRNC